MDRIFSQQSGEGQPVILIHGFCETHEIWSDLSQTLSKNFQVVSIDLPGFGKSALPPTPFSINDIAEQVWNWLDDNNIMAQPVLIGHSLGGYVALAMAEQRPQQLKGFCLFHSTALADTPEKKQNRSKVIEFVRKNGVDPFIDSFIPGLFFNQNHPAIPKVDRISRKTHMDTLIAYTVAMRDRPDRLKLLSEFEKQILIIAGEQDSIIPLQTLEEQAKTLKNGEISVFSGVGHMGMLEDVARSQKVVSGFIMSCL